ncbi:MAG: cadherin domain-containing protein [Cyclobacteriaceae bacterium]
MSRYFFQTFFSFALIVTAQAQSSYQLFAPTGDGNSDSFYAADSSMVYSNTDVTGTIEPLSSSIDFGYFYGSNDEASLVSPSSYFLYNLNSNWSVQKTTLFRETTLTETDFNSLSDEALYDAFKAGNNQAESKIGLSVGQVIAFMTNDGDPTNTRVGLILIEEIQGTFNVGDFIRFKIKDEPMLPFITTWQTTTASESITIPTTGTGYDYTVNWGDGTVETGFTGDASHTYVSAGTYTVSVTGDFPRIYFNDGNEGQDNDKIKSIEQWGDISWSSMNKAFKGCYILVYNATDSPDLLNVTDMTGMFRLSSLNGADLNNWDVSTVTNMSHMFQRAVNFSGDISDWDVSNVTEMGAMFNSARDFNSDISGWNVSKVTSLGYTFNGATSFNIDLSAWDVSSVTYMGSVFAGASAFNQDISSWDVSNTTDMGWMFREATAFDQDLSNWNIGDVTTLDLMFENSSMSQSNYDQTLEGWSRLDPGETQIPTGLTLGATGLEFCESADARQRLIDDYGWTFSGDDFACDGLVAYYPLNGNANDSTDNNNDGILGDGTTPSTYPTLSTDRFGNANSAFDFDGADDYIEVAYSANLNSDEFTVSVWVKPDGNPSNTGSIYSSRDSFKGYMAYNSFDTEWKWTNHFGTGGEYQGISGNPVEQNAWVHLVLKYDGSESSIYENGKLVSSLPVTITKNTVQSFLIGAGANEGPMNFFFPGSIDDIRVYDRALNTSEIRDLYYEGGYSPPAEIAVSDADGNDYSGVVIGTQVWMGENMATTKYNDGTTIPKVTDNTAWSNLTTPGYAWYDNDSATNAPTYGTLYNWYAVETGELCPTGWHVPSDTEWTTLEDYLIANGYNYDGTTSGNKLAKSISTSAGWSASGVEGTIGNSDFPAKQNASSFGAVPGGFRWGDGTFTGLGSNTLWSTSTESSSSNNWGRYMQNNQTYVDRSSNDKNIGMSIRCIRDQAVRTATNITSFALPGTVGAVEIDSTNHNITIVGLVTSDSIAPTIALSGGASIAPASGIVQDYSSPVTYTVTAEDGSTTQEWTVYASKSEGLVAYYPLDGNANDSTGNGNDGTVYNAVDSTDRFGMADNAYYFDGVDDYIDMGNVNDMSTGDFSIVAWINRDEGGITNARIVSKGAGNDATAGYSLFGSESNISFIVGNGTTRQSINTTFSHSEWTQLVGVRSGGTISIYRNGEFVLQGTGVSESLSTSASFFIGDNDGQSTPFPGLIDDVRVYNQALSADDIATLYTENNWGTPILHSTHPNAAVPGNQIRLYGKHFDEPNTVVSFDGTVVTPDSTLHNVAYLTVPNIGHGPAEITVINDFGASGDIDFTVVREGHGGYFGEQNIVSSADGAISVFGIDMDGDGDTDVLTASYIDDKIAWVENEGDGSYSEHIISTLADGAKSIFAIDLEGDNDIDVFSANQTDNKVIWFENDGSQNFTARIISDTVDNAHSVYVADMDGDGDLDLLSAARDANEITWYENNGSQQFSSHLVSDMILGAVGVFADDLDGDGDMDILSAAFSDNTVYWHINDGNQNFTLQSVGSLNRAESVRTADFDKDGDLDVVAAGGSSGGMAWFRNDGTQNFSKVLIDNTLVGRSAYPADLDGDGDLDVLSAFPNDDMVAWFENVEGEIMTTSKIITISADAAFHTYAIDLDNDGDLDVLSASIDDDKIAWYENQSFDESGLVAFYPFSGDANDSSEYANHGTETGGVSLATDRFGASNSAYDFNGTDAYLDMGNVNDFTTEDFTVSAWINRDEGGISNARIVSKGAGNDDLAGYALYGSDTQVYFAISKGDGSTRPFATSEINHSLWNHLVGVKDGNGLKLYVNGVLADSVEGLTETITNASKLLIGENDGQSTLFPGLIDDVRIYDRALSESEIFDLYTKEVPPLTIASISPTSGPIGTLVTITGTNLRNSSLQIAGTQLLEISNDGTTLIGFVMPGTTSGAVDVTTTGDSARSAESFTVTIPSPNAALQLGADIDGEAPDDRSGYSVSIAADGQTLAIGAFDNDGAGNNAGHVRVYKNTEGSWAQVGSDIDGEAASDNSGLSVSLSANGQTLAIGAYENDGNGTNAGHVRVYENNGGTWTQVGADIDGEAAVDNSGFSVSLSADGRTLAIGAVYNNGTGADAGHVRVYENTAGTWMQVGTDIDGEAAGDNSGWSVSLSADGKTVAIGAIYNDGTATNAGHVRVYENNAGSWMQVGNDIDGEAADDELGYSVSLSADGQTLAIGARYNDGTDSNAGHVRVYENIASNWTQVGNDIDGEAAGDQFGYSVSLSSNGQTLAIGAMQNDGTSNNAGHVQVYENNVGTWTQIGNDIDGEAGGDNMGWSVSLSADGQTLAIGAYRNDGNGNAAGHVRVYSLEQVNNLPVITASQSFDLAENAANGTSVGTVVATDADDGTTFSSWSIVSGNDTGVFALDATTGVLTVVDNADLDFETTVAYSLILTVSDGDSTSAQETVTINITDVNDNTPVISASQSFDLAENAANGTSVGTVVATDADDGTTFSSWSIVSGNDAGVFDLNTTTGVLTVVDNADLDFETTVSYSLTLTVSDGDSTSTQETVTINITDVNDNTPVITTSQSFDLAENATNGTSVGTVVGSDADDGTTFSSWAIVSGNDAGVFDLNATSGVLTVVDYADLDFETTVAYSLTLTVSDGDSTSAQETVTINITDVNDNTPLITTSQSFDLAENAANGTSVGTVVATDADDGTTFSNWMIVSGNDAGVFGLDATTGALIVVDNADLDFETTVSYSLTLTVSDGDSTSTQETVTINITDVNDNTPLITTSQSFDLAENAVNSASVGTVVATDADDGTTFSSWSIVSGNDAGVFDLNTTTGVLTVVDNADLDFETTVSYSLILTVSDGDSTSAQETVMINITDVNDNTPVITTSQSFDLAENATNGTSVGTVVASDADDGTTFSSWAIISGNDAGVFDLNATTGVLTVVDNADLDFETTVAYSLTLTVSDGDSTSTQETVTINITDVNDNTPVITASQSFDLAENATNGTSVGTVVATDADDGTTFSSWSIVSGNDAGVFDLNATTGELTVIDSTNLDYETTTSHSLTLTVSDGDSTSAETIVTVNVLDIDELNDSTDITSFVIASGDGHPEPVEGTIDTSSHTVTATVPYGTSLTSLAPTITVSTGATINPESGSSLDFTTAQTYTVTAQNGEAQDWTVTITNVDNDSTDILSLSHPELVSGSLNIDASAHTISATVSDGTDLATLAPTITVSTGATINPESGTAQDFSSAVTYMVTAQNGDTQDWTVTVVLAEELNDSTDIASFVFASGDGHPEPVEGTIDTSSHTVTATVPYGTSLTSLAPTITVSTGATINPESGTAQDFSSTVTYTVTAENGDKQEWLVEVIAELNGEADILSFSTSNELQEATINTGNKSVEVYYAQGADVAEVITTFSLSSGAELRLEGKTQISDSSIIDLTDTVVYYVVAENGIDSTEWLISATFAVPDNNAPSSISLSADSVYEEQTPGTLIGLFTTEDADTEDTHSYALVTGENDDHNLFFDIKGDSLVTKLKLDFENEINPYIILVQTSDGKGGVYKQSFEIRIIDINEDGNNEPITILLSNNELIENSGPDAMVGLLETIDPDGSSDAHSYELTAGGEEFKVVGDTLKSKVDFDFETKQSYQVTVRSTDAGQASVDKTFIINIIDEQEGSVNNPPTAIILSNVNIPASGGEGFEVGEFVTIDADVNDIHRYTILEGTDEFDVSQSGVLTTRSNLEGSTYAIRVASSDGVSTLEKDFVIAVTSTQEITSDFEAIVNEKGKRQENYRIIAVPLKTVGLGAFFKGFDVENLNKTWRILKYTTGQGHEDLEGGASLKAGEGYWFASDQEIDFEIPKGNKWASLNEDGQFELTLSEGWNMIGNPFFEDIDWAAVVEWNIAQGNVEREDFTYQDAAYDQVVTYNGGWSNTRELKKFQGGFLKMNRAVTIHIPKQGFASNGRVGDVSMGYVRNNQDWQLSIHMAYGLRSTNLSGIGMHQDAVTGLDKMDQQLPPTLGNHYSFQLLEKETNIAKNIVGPVDRFIWDYELKVDEKETVLRWDKDMLTSLEKSVLIYLPESDQAYDMKVIDNLVLDPSKISTIQFAYGADELLSKLIIPSIVYPNPMSTSATFELYIGGEGAQDVALRIYSLDGKLMDVQNQQLPGQAWSKISWTPTGLNAGVYLYQISHGGYQSEMNRLILTK